MLMYAVYELKIKTKLNLNKEQIEILLLRYYDDNGTR